MGSKHWPDEESAMQHSPDFDQSWARKAPFHHHLQSAHSQRPCLPRVYPNQSSDRNQSPQQNDGFPSNYDYPDGRHLLNESTHSMRNQWTHPESHRLYENCQPSRIRELTQDGRHVMPDEKHQPISRLHSATIEPTSHLEDNIRYDLPAQHYNRSSHHNEEIMQHRQQQAVERHFSSAQVPGNFEGPMPPVRHSTVLPTEPSAFCCEMTVNGRPVKEVGGYVDHHSMKHSSQRQKSCEPIASYNANRERSEEMPLNKLSRQHLQGNFESQQVVCNVQENQLRSRLQHAEAQFIHAEVLQNTNPFSCTKQPTIHSSNSNWIPKTKVQSVVQMINKRNDPVAGIPDEYSSSQSRKSNLTPNANFDDEMQERRKSFDCYETSTMERRMERSNEHPPKNGIVKKQTCMMRTAIAVPAQAIENPPPAPPLPQNFFKRSALPNAKQSKTASKARESASEYSNSSTISTDSALSSDGNASVLSGSADTRRDVTTEADFLLLYFKQHAHVLHFVGIQLPKALLSHINRLPENPRVELIETNKTTAGTANGDTKGASKTTAKEKMMRRASSKKVDKKAKRQVAVHPHANVRKPSENDSNMTASQQPLVADKQRVAVGNTIISISEGPYPGYPEHQAESNEKEIRQKLLEIKKQEMIEDFDDVSRQMVSREASLSISSDDRQTLTMSTRSAASTKRLTSDVVFTDDDFSEQGRKQRNESSPLTEAQRAESRSGRFMKKSAAALIARKQTSRNNSPSPRNNCGAKGKTPSKKKFDSKPTEHRIAAEIANLREREDELRRNRYQLGLPSLEDIVDIWRQGQGGYGRPPTNGAKVHPNQYAMDCVGIGAPLRSARSFDHLHFEANEANNREKLCARVAKSESFHHLQVESNCDNYEYDTGERYGGEAQVRRTNTAASEKSLISSARNGMHVNSSKRNNFDYPNVQIKIRPNENIEESETLDSRMSDSRGNTRLRRNYHEEYPAVRL